MISKILMIWRIGYKVSFLNMCLTKSMIVDALGTTKYYSINATSGWHTTYDFLFVFSSLIICFVWLIHLKLFTFFQKRYVLDGTNFQHKSQVLTFRLSKIKVATFLQNWKSLSRFQFIKNYWNKANTCLHILSIFPFSFFSDKVCFGRYKLLTQISGFYILSVQNQSCDISSI